MQEKPPRGPLLFAVCPATHASYPFPPSSQHLQLLSSHRMLWVIILILIEQHSPEIGNPVHPGAQRHRDRSLRDIRHHYVAHEILLPFGACSSPALLVNASAKLHIGALAHPHVPPYAPCFCFFFISFISDQLYGAMPRIP